MKIINVSKTLLKTCAILSMVVAIAVAVPLQTSATHAAPPAPTNLSESISKTYPGLHTLHWNSSVSYAGLYYVIYTGRTRVAETTNLYYTLNNNTQSSGDYIVAAADRLDGYETQGPPSNSIYVTLGYIWQKTGASWNSCFTPGAPTPPGLYDGCFAAGTSMYALRNVNVKYSASGARLGQSFMRVIYRQKFAALPTGYTKYDVNVIVGYGTYWKYITTLQLPAGGPEVIKESLVSLYMPIDHPNELELQWVNDSMNSGGDANLQIDSIELSRP